MGRGREGVMNQSNKKNVKRCGLIPNQDNQMFRDGIKPAINRTVIGLPEDFLNDSRKMNPREVANILVNM